MKLKKVVIIGMGLIGGSIGKAIIKKGLADEIIGVCRRQSSLERAISEKSLTKGFVNNYAEAASGADIVFIATPVHTVKEVLEGLSEVLTDGKTLVTDVGSTKKEIVDYAAAFSENFSFIGTHPLAGSEKAGVEYSSAELFENSVCVLTPDDNLDEENINKLKNLWEGIGASVIVMSPEDHDKSLAFSSHLPHVVAYALASMLKGECPKCVFSAGFRDTTRIASSDPELWSDIFLSNRDNVLKSIEKYKEALSRIEENIKEEQAEELKKTLEEYKKLRDGIF